MTDRPFIDSNIFVYLFSTDVAKADQSESLLQKGGVVSIQVLNEITNVARRKLRMSWSEIDEIIDVIKTGFKIEPLTIQTYQKGRKLAEKYSLSFYDSLIVAAALIAGSKTLYSEDMQNGLLVEETLNIVNPYEK